MSTRATVAELWTIYAGFTLPADAPREQREQLRQAFFAGFLECFSVTVSLAELNEHEAVAVLERLRAETLLFCHETIARGAE